MEAYPTRYDRNNPLLMSAEILLGSLEAAEELGVSVEPSLALAQIDASQLRHPDQFIPLHSVVGFLNDMAERSGCDHFGFLVALKQPPSQFARVGQLVKFAATLGEAIDDAIRFSLLNSQFSRWELENDGRYVTMIRRTRVAYDEPMIQLQALALTVVYKAMMGLVGGDIELQQVSFAHAAHAHQRRMEAYFSCPVLFNQPYNALVFSCRALELPIASGDEKVYRLIKAQLENLSKGLNYGDDLATRVIHHIKQAMGSRYCSLEFIGQTMGIHPRTLQRQLAQEGVTFKQLLNQVRQGLAEEYLVNSSISVAELSSFLGYRNPSAFSRAFKRASGLSPEHWKLSRS
ncbi:AraC family transcriptional regulator [Aequoribacter sp.]|uniref:AraC family transcriptional regulator n=1 Tax=Aequoribacter sp. TaxID=2847771 RepID=UPI003F698393